MPTVIVLDVSLSMCRPLPGGTATVSNNDSEDDMTPTRKTLAIELIKQFLDHIETHCKLEFVTLMTFSNLYEVVSPFDRDLDAIRSTLISISNYDRTNYEAMLSGISETVHETWGTTVPVQILLVTDGSGGFGTGCLKDAVKNTRQFSFPCKMNVMSLSESDEKNYTENCQMLQKLIDTTCGNGNGMVYFPEGNLSSKACSSALSKLCAKDFTPYKGTIKCGNLSSKITLCPPPQPSSRHEKRYDFSDTIEIIGFMEGNDLASPAAHSRHLLLPLKSDSTFGSAKSEDPEEDFDGKTPNFCVLLHGALKIDNKCAVVEVGSNWFGFLYTWADNKKKSNLMLSILPPGLDVVPWLGSINLLGPLEEFVTNRSLPIAPTFPVKPPEKKSYGGTPSTVWISPEQVNNDMTKLLRNCKKLPDKNNAFYKELNRIRRWALSLGFEEILESVAQILERECMVSTSAHPDASIQLTHAASQLRNPASYNKTILPHGIH